MAQATSKIAKKTLNIEIISDNICPWCFVGKRNLEYALTKLDQSLVDINIKWTAYELDPTLPPVSVDKQQRYLKKFGPQFKNMGNRLMNIGSNCTPPIKFKFGGKIGSTINSHRLVCYAKKFNKENEMVEMLMHSYFELNKDIADKDTLIEMGSKVGLSKVDEFLASTECMDEVIAQLKRSKHNLRVSGVPTFIINEKQRFSGGRAPDFFLLTFQTLGLYKFKANDFDDE